MKDVVYRDDDISLGKEQVKIECINEVDRYAPDNFVYIPQCIYSDKVKRILASTGKGKFFGRFLYNRCSLNDCVTGFSLCCDCEDGCQNAETCVCLRMSTQGRLDKPLYNSKGLLTCSYRRSRSSPVYLTLAHRSINRISEKVPTSAYMNVMMAVNAINKTMLHVRTEWCRMASSCACKYSKRGIFGPVQLMLNSFILIDTMVCHLGLRDGECAVLSQWLGANL